MVVRRIQEDFMAEVIGVRFKEVGKIYYFDPLDNKLSVGDMVIVETARGLECGVFPVGAGDEPGVLA